MSLKRFLQNSCALKKLRWAIKEGSAGGCSLYEHQDRLRSSVRIQPWPLRWVLGQGSLLPLSQGEAFTLASISYLAILVKYILAKKKLSSTYRSKTKLANNQGENQNCMRNIKASIFIQAKRQRLANLYTWWKVGKKSNSCKSRENATLVCCSRWQILCECYLQMYSLDALWIALQLKVAGSAVGEQPDRR